VIAKMLTTVVINIMSQLVVCRAIAAGIAADKNNFHLFRVIPYSAAKTLFVLCASTIKSP